MNSLKRIASSCTVGSKQTTPTRHLPTTATHLLCLTRRATNKRGGSSQGKIKNTPQFIQLSKLPAMKSAVFLAVLLFASASIAHGSRCRFVNGKWWGIGCNPGPKPECGCKDCLGGGFPRCRDFCIRAFCPAEPQCGCKDCFNPGPSPRCKDFCSRVRCAAPECGCKDCNGDGFDRCRDFCIRALCPAEPQCGCNDCRNLGTDSRCRDFCIRASCPADPVCDRSKCCSPDTPQACRDSVCATVRCPNPNPTPPPPCDCCNDGPKTVACADLCARSDFLCPAPSKCECCTSSAQLGDCELFCSQNPCKDTSNCNCCQGIPPFPGCEAKCAQVAKDKPFCNLVPQRPPGGLP
ncbi:hypothetical protein BSKO_06504 [Bryopsis sp. KO-2023]|nr:hypothetical protein BSKO_06504 [Bryopsis sp. KO-2023]